MGSRRTLVIGLFILGLVISSGVFGYKYAEATLPTQDGTWGQWIREAYIWANSMLTLNYADVGRVLIVTAGHNVTTDADIQFSGDTLTVTKLGATTLTGDISAAGNDLTGAGWVNGTSAAYSNAYVTTYYLGTTSLNARLGGNWGSLDLTTTGDVSATWLNGTSLKASNWYNGATQVDDLIDYPATPTGSTLWVSGGTVYVKSGSTGLVTSNADDDTAINGALTAGGDVYLKPGTYSCNGNVTVTAGSNLIGAPGAILSFSGDFMVRVTGDDSTVQGIEVDGDAASGTYGILLEADYSKAIDCYVHGVGPAGVAGFGICAEYATGILVTNSRVEATGLDGIHLRFCDNSTVSYCTVIDSGDDGIASLEGVDNTIIGNNVDRENAASSAGNLIGVYADDGTIVEENHVKNSPRFGIIVTDHLGLDPIRCKVLGNTVKGSGVTAGGTKYSGIALQYANYTTVADNTVDLSLYHGIWVYSSSFNDLRGNVVTRSFQAGDSWAGGICLEYYSTYNVISGGIIDGGTYGVLEAGGASSDYNQFGGFTILNAGTPFHLEGTHSHGVNYFAGSTWTTSTP